MKYRIVSKYTVDENDSIKSFNGYELQVKPWWFSAWKKVKTYRIEKELEHDIVWSFEMMGKITRKSEYAKNN